jgi:hypothetical protein
MTKMSNISNDDFLILIGTIYTGLIGGAILIAYIKDKFD